MDEIVGNQVNNRETQAEDMVWIEIVSRHGDVIARHRARADDLRIGRAYDNDIVLDDPYVAPHHLRIVRDGRGEWAAEDLGSVNGLFAARGKIRQPRISLDSDKLIRIGHTYLRLRHASHPVAPERVAEAAGRALFLAVVLALVVLGLEALSQWLQEIGEPKLSRYILPLIVLPLIVVGWAAIWALLTRIFSRQARFERHLLIATAAVLVFSLLDEIGDFLAFAASWPAIKTYDYFTTWIVLAVACFFHLRVIGLSHLRLKAGLVGALMIAGIAIQSLDQFDGRDFQPRPDLRFLPPVLRIAPVQTETAFFDDINRIKERLDRDRTEAPAAGASPLDDEDDD